MAWNCPSVAPAPAAGRACEDADCHTPRKAHAAREQPLGASVDPRELAAPEGSYGATAAETAGYGYYLTTEDSPEGSYGATAAATAGYWYYLTTEDSPCSMDTCLPRPSPCCP